MDHDFKHEWERPQKRQRAARWPEYVGTADETAPALEHFFSERHRTCKDFHFLRTAPARRSFMDHDFKHEWERPQKRQRAARWPEYVGTADETAPALEHFFSERHRIAMLTEEAIDAGIL